jgi:hypothetical protein
MSGIWLPNRNRQFFVPGRSTPVLVVTSPPIDHRRELPPCPGRPTFDYLKGVWSASDGGIRNFGAPFPGRNSFEPFGSGNPNPPGGGGGGAALSAPSSLAASAISSSEIDLSWVNNAKNYDAISIERSLSSGSGYSEIATPASGSTTYNNTSGLSALTQYYYRARAKRNNGPRYGPYSNVANATTLSANSLLDAVAAYTFEEADGATVIDRTGRGNDLTDHGTCQHTTEGSGHGKVSKALATDTTPRYVDRASTSDLSMGTGVSVSMIFWIYFGAGGGLLSHTGFASKWDGTQNEYAIYHEANYAINTYWRWEVRNVADTTTTNVRTNNFEVTSSPGFTNQWVMVEVWYDEANTTLGMCLNNNATYTYTNTGYSGGIRAGTANFAFNHLLNNTFGNVWYDCFGMWKRARMTSTERSTIYNSGSGKQWDYS